MTSTRRRRFLLGALGAPVLALAGCGDDTTPVEARYATAFKRAFDDFRLVGALASVRAPGASEWTQALGYADLASRTPMDLANHFSIRSVTKSYTVTLILQLVRDKALRLDDKLDHYVPGVPNGATITLADLAGMTSGIADYSTTDAFAELFGPDPGAAVTEQQLVDFAVPYSPRFNPGAAYEYSNTNTVLLGMIVEKATGLTMAQAVTSMILTPLGLSRTSYPYVVPLPVPHPLPYEVTFATGETELLPFISPTSLAGAGAMVSTLDDMQTWGRALGDGRLIGAELQLERINRSRVVTNGPTYDRYGLGIGILKGWRGHTGSGLGFQAATFYDPGSTSTIAVLVNATPFRGPPNLNYAEKIFEALADVVASQ